MKKLMKSQDKNVGFHSPIILMGKKRIIIGKINLIHFY